MALPLSDSSGLPLDPVTLQAMEQQQMLQNMDQQGGTANTRQNMAAISQGVSNLFPSQQVQQATKVQNALKSAQLTQAPDEAPLDFSMRQLQANRNAIAPYSPESAAALNTQMMKLAQVKFEQQKLTAQDQRESVAASDKHAEEQAALPAKQAAGNFAAATQNIGYVPTKDNSPLGLSFKAFDVTDPAQLAAAKAAADKSGMPIVSPDHAATILNSADTAATRYAQALATANLQYGNLDTDTVRHMAVDAIFNPSAVPARGPAKMAIERFYSDNGILPSDIAQAKTEYRALGNAASSAARREGNMAALQNSMQGLGSQVLQTLGGVSRTDFAPLNSAVMAGKTAFSDPGEARYAVAIQSLVNDYARVISGGTGVSSDAARTEAWSIVNKAQGPGAIRAAVDQMSNKETGIIKNGAASAVEMLANPKSYPSLLKIQMKAGYKLTQSDADTAAVSTPAVPPGPATGAASQQTDYSKLWQ